MHSCAPFIRWHVNGNPHADAYSFAFVKEREKKQVMQFRLFKESSGPPALTPALATHQVGDPSLVLFWWLLKHFYLLVPWGRGRKGVLLNQLTSLSEQNTVSGPGSPTALAHSLLYWKHLDLKLVHGGNPHSYNRNLSLENHDFQNSIGWLWVSLTIWCTLQILPRKFTHLPTWKNFVCGVISVMLICILMFSYSPFKRSVVPVFFPQRGGLWFPRKLKLCTRHFPFWPVFPKD